MKKFKFYMSLILVLSIMASVCSGVFASEIVEYNISWILKPSESVSGHVYSSTPYGFIIKDGAWQTGTGAPTTAIVGDNGFVMSPNEVVFDGVYDNGYIPYRTENGAGVMNIKGETIIPEGVYEAIEILDETHFLCTKKYPEGEWGSDWGIFDAEGNAYVDFGSYSEYYYYDGTIVVSKVDEEYQYSYALIDYDGNVLVDFGECEYIRPLTAKDRYIAEYKDDEKSYLCHIDGRTLATFEADAFPYQDDCISVSVYNSEEETTYYRFYNYDGELLDEKTGEEFEGAMIGFVDVSGIKTKYYIAEDENHNLYVSDKDGNCVYSNNDVNIQAVFNDKFIYVYNKEYNAVSLLDMNGNTVIPFGEFNKIAYCEELDIYAFDNGEEINESICVGRITPITVMVDGAKLEFDQNPVAVNGRTLLPLRAVFDALGAYVDWDQATQTVTSRRGDIEVKVTIGSDKMYVNGVEKILDVPAQALNNRSLVPVRAVGEAFECNVGWDGATFTVNITK
ncbi:MAG: copper amine oxidase N-terminal domain-containing protein [Clostridia bacterium]|nr:copper amine oxidase N-terminal domain-containing protein [Clostridia bacterium]